MNFLKNNWKWILPVTVLFLYFVPCPYIFHYDSKNPGNIWGWEKEKIANADGNKKAQPGKKPAPVAVDPEIAKMQKQLEFMKKLADANNFVDSSQTARMNRTDSVNNVNFKNLSQSQNATDSQVVELQKKVDSLGQVLVMVKNEVKKNATGNAKPKSTPKPNGNKDIKNGVIDQFNSGSQSQAGAAGRGRGNPTNNAETNAKIDSLSMQIADVKQGQKNMEQNLQFQISGVKGSVNELTARVSSVEAKQASLEGQLTNLLQANTKGKKN